MSAGSRPRASHGFWVATPVGQVSVWHFCAWMQPIGEHRLPGDVDHVAAERERDDRVVGQPELAGADEGHLLVQAALGERRVDPGEPQLERQRHGVGEDQRRRAGTALAAVDGHEVDARGRCRPSASVSSSQKRQVADGGLDPDRQPGLGGQQLHPVEQAVDVGELGVPRRADAVLALR